MPRGGAAFRLAACHALGAEPAPAADGQDRDNVHHGDVPVHQASKRHHRSESIIADGPLRSGASARPRGTPKAAVSAERRLGSGRAPSTGLYGRPDFDRAQHHAATAGADALLSPPLSTSRRSWRPVGVGLDLWRDRLYVGIMAAHRGRANLALRLLAIAVLTVAVVVVVIAGASVALELAPAGLLVLTLLFGRYPGERVIRRLARRAASVRVVRRVCIPRAPRSLGARVAALAVPGAGRAPPVGVLI
jgi:hypothetical protein